MKAEINRRRFLRLGFFVHPVPLGTVGLLALNDAVLKERFGNWWTGKISDFCGLFFFPLFLCALLVLSYRAVSRRETWLTWPQLFAAVFVTDFIFIAVKVMPPAARGVETVLGRLGFPSRIVSDPSDLLALTVNVALIFYARYAIAAGRKSNI